MPVRPTTLLRLLVAACLLTTGLTLASTTASVAGGASKRYTASTGPYPGDGTNYGYIKFLRDTRAIDTQVNLNDDTEDGYGVAGYFVVTFTDGTSKKTTPNYNMGGHETTSSAYRSFLFTGHRIASVRAWVCLFPGSDTSTLVRCAKSGKKDNPRT